MTTVTFQGEPVSLNDELPAVGSAAPDFSLTGGDLVDKSLQDYSGKKVLLNIVPSLDGSETCQVSTRKFNEAIDARDDVACLVVSADLPFAAGRFCGAEGLDNIQTMSMLRDKKFAEDYGVLINAGALQGLTCRAIVVIDEGGNIAYTQLVSEIVDEPDYDAAMQALN